MPESAPAVDEEGGDDDLAAGAASKQRKPQTKAELQVPARPPALALSLAPRPSPCPAVDGRNRGADHIRAGAARRARSVQTVGPGPFTVARVPRRREEGAALVPSENNCVITVVLTHLILYPSVYPSPSRPHANPIRSDSGRSPTRRIGGSSSNFIRTSSRLPSRRMPQPQPMPGRTGRQRPKVAKMERTKKVKKLATTMRCLRRSPRRLSCSQTSKRGANSTLSTILTTPSRRPSTLKMRTSYRRPCTPPQLPAALRSSPQLPTAPRSSSQLRTASRTHP